jgi:hypothetical protein
MAEREAQLLVGETAGRENRCGNDVTHSFVYTGPEAPCRLPFLIHVAIE